MKGPWGSTGIPERRMAVFKYVVEELAVGKVRPRARIRLHRIVIRHKVIILASLSITNLKKFDNFIPWFVIWIIRSRSKFVQLVLDAANVDPTLQCL